MNKFSIILAVIILLSISCNKNNRSINLSGNIYDPSFNTTIPNAKITLKAAKIVSGIYNPSYVEINSTYTDSKGNFSMEIPVEKVSGYRIMVSKDQYFDYEEDINTDKFEKEDTYISNLEIYPKATIRLDIKNTSPQGMDDEIRYKFNNIDQDCKTCCTNSPISGIGPDFSVISECDLRGQKMLSITYVVTKKGNQKIINDSIWVEAFKTTTYTINY